MKKTVTLLFLFPLLLNAQIVTVTQPVAGVGVGGNAATYSMTAFTPSANSLLVLFVAVGASVLAAPTVTGGGLTWTLQASSLNPQSSTNGYYIFWAKVGSSPASTTIIFDCTADQGTGCALSVAQFTGYNRDKANPIKQTIFNSTAVANTSPTITFSTALTKDNAYMAGWGNISLNNTLTSTPITGWTEINDFIYNPPKASFSTAVRSAGETTTGAYTFTSSASVQWVAMGVEVYAANRGLPVSFF